MSPWIYLLGGVGTLLTGAVGAWVLLRKLPIEARKLSVETVDVNVNIAGKLRDDALEDRNDAREGLEKLRQEFEAYRRDTDARLAEMAIEVRAARAGEVEAKRQSASYRKENTILRGRVDELEREVASLKASGPHNP